MSQTLGTALGDWPRCCSEPGSQCLRRCTRTNFSRVTLFWAAFILSPLGATFGEGLLASAVIAVFIVMCVLALPQRAGRHPGEAEV